MPNENLNRCPICQRNATDEIEFKIDAHEVTCELCGTYRCPWELVETLPHVRREACALPPRRLTRQASEQGAPLSTSAWKPGGARPRLTSTRRYHRKFERSSSGSARRSSHPGESIPIDPNDAYPLFDAADQSEARYLIRHAVERRLLSGQAGGRLGPFVVSVEGWEYLDPSGAGAGAKGRVLVAMSFDAELDEAYIDGICAALREDCQLDPKRIDNVSHNDKICDRIPR